ncbi:hypothetical protein RND81_10G033500 [Saponaria officinalis]|uniref:Uncharacterized protein n=1 Tax=Saponaria officinalis TaxID=3572 RepID=A0AAW1HXS6_SAPOF
MLYNDSCVSRTLSQIFLPETKAFRKSPTIPSTTSFSLLVIHLITTFVMTLHKLIVLKFSGDSGLLLLGIRAMKVLLKYLGILLEFRTFRTHSMTSFFMKYHHF